MQKEFSGQRAQPKRTARLAEKVFSKDENWEDLKKDIMDHLLSMTTKTFILNRNEIDDIEVSAVNMSDGSMMITYKKIA